MRKDSRFTMENKSLVSHTIENDIFIKASLERVFRALTEKAELERWFFVRADVDLRPGGAIRFKGEPDVVEKGTILVVDPPHRLSYTWEALEPTPTTITFELTAENDGTRLRHIHAGIGEGEGWDQYYAFVRSGWPVHLGDLRSWIETGFCDPPGLRVGTDLVPDNASGREGPGTDD
jgi:uncharacterized protein YndB with AHSA1/START domain